MGIDLIVANGTVVSAAGVEQTDIAVNDGRIMALGSRRAFPKAERVVDASGKIVIPGLIPLGKVCLYIPPPQDSGYGGDISVSRLYMIFRPICTMPR